MGSKRGKNFSGAEEKLVTLAYLHVSQDPILGNGQRGNFFWKRAAAFFNQERVAGSENRPEKSIEGKWIQIRKDTVKFCGAFATIAALDESGTTFEQTLEKALALYKARHPKLEDFPYLDCWLILRHVPRWAELKDQAKKTTPMADITNGNDIQGQSTMPHGNSPPAPHSSQSSGNVIEEDLGMSRPTGTKKAKEAIKRQRIFDDTLIKQAEAASLLTAAIVEKVALLKEQSMVASFALKDENGQLSNEGKEFFALKRSRDLARFKRDLELEDHTFAPQQNQREMSTPQPRSTAASEENDTDDFEANQIDTEEDRRNNDSYGEERELPTAHRTSPFEEGSTDSPSNFGSDSPWRTQ